MDKVVVAIMIPAMRLCTFTSDDMDRVIQPILYVRGSNSGLIAQKRQQLVLSLLPQAEVLVLETGLQIMNTNDLAEGLANFFAAQPIQNDYSGAIFRLC
jgi:hypothetical protein